MPFYPLIGKNDPIPPSPFLTNYLQQQQNEPPQQPTTTRRRTLRKTETLHDYEKFIINIVPPQTKTQNDYDSNVKENQFQSNHCAVESIEESISDD